jgi:hypothetical protein
MGSTPLDRGHLEKRNLEMKIALIGAGNVGGVKNSRYLEPLAGLNIYLGYGAGRGSAIAPAWIGIH